MMALLLASLLAFSDSTHGYYATKNAAALEALLAQAESREMDLLCRYRLYPLTERPSLVSNLPASLDDGTARELALLAGLWGYRAARAPLHLAMKYGLRSDRLLKAAAARDPDEPFLLLVEGQSLLFRPAIAGGDARAALVRFQRLRAVLPRRPGTDMTVMEADLWIWYTLRRLDAAEAAKLHTRLLAANPPRLYREFLLSPP